MRQLLIVSDRSHKELTARSQAGEGVVKLWLFQDYHMTTD